eukprot:TRINITY_DN23513_c1_g1_i1.p1 TRINITY_DN23513_c1_g1~~TRINITY_DN23513_c1_g1_i1.p1  ORF type:complete len:105 (+),score=3.64 TRINITY_DN23513_c1_g1_i1:46-360(+)
MDRKLQPTLVLYRVGAFLACAYGAKSDVSSLIKKKGCFMQYNDVWILILFLSQANPIVCFLLCLGKASYEQTQHHHPTHTHTNWTIFHLKIIGSRGIPSPSSYI